MRLYLLATFLILLGLPVAVAAQARSTAAHADSVRRMTPGELTRLYAAAPARSAAAAAHLEHGLVAQRLYELTGDEDVRRGAERSFDRAKDLDPQLAWAHYGYGWALARAGGVALPLPALRRIVTFQSMAEIVGLDAVSRAQRSLRRALELDAGHEPAAVELARAALTTRSGDDLVEATRALQALLAASGGTVAAHTALAEIETLRGNTAAALEAAKAAATLSDAPATRRLLALAMLVDPTQVDAAFELYLSAIGRAPEDAELAHAYESDINSVATKDELEQWERLAPFHRQVWLREFWERRAHESLRSPGERLAEHFRRVRHAEAHYRRGSDVGARPMEALLPRGIEQLPYDDRGAVFIRWGEADTVVTSPSSPDDEPPINETWVYYRHGDGPLAFHFFRFAGTVDWILGDVPTCEPFYFALGTRKGLGGQRLPGALQLGRGPGVEQFARFYEDRAFIDKRNMLVAQHCRTMTRDVWRLAQELASTSDEARARAVSALLVEIDTERRRELQTLAEARRDALRALRTEDARPDYDAPLPILSTVYSFRGDSTTDVTAAVLVPGAVFTPTVAAEGTIYPLRVLFAVRDSVSGRTARTDQTLNYVSEKAVEKGRYVRAMVQLEAVPFSSGEFRLRVENAGAPSQGQIQSGALTVHDYAGGALQISDVVIAEAEGGRLQRGETLLSPIPTHQVEVGRTFRLFYELYNLAPDTPYRTTIQIAAKAPSGLLDQVRSLFGRRRSIDLRFEEVAGRSVGKYGLQQVRSIGADLAADGYTLTITVEDLRSGAKVTRSTPLNIIPIQRND